MLEFAFGSKRAEPSPQAAVRPRMLLPPMAEGHMLVDRAAERIQAYRRLRRIRAIREERRPARLRAHALAKTTAPAGGESRLFEPFRSPEPMLAPGPAARPPWHERFWARTRHMAAASGRILMAAGALGSVAYMTVLYYIEYIPEVRHLHIEAYPFLRDFKPEYIRFLISYGLPTAVGAFALSKSVLKFIDRIKAAKDLWHQFHHPHAVPSADLAEPPPVPASRPEAAEPPRAATSPHLQSPDQSGWGG